MLYHLTLIPPPECTGWLEQIQWHFAAGNGRDKPLPKQSGWG